jgi:arabinofuranosyltransferase
MTVRNRNALLICISGLLLLVLHALYYMPFLSDDALISLRYSQRFMQGLGLTWNDGIRVEGYSNLSWVLLSALLGAAGMNLVDSVRILGFMSCFMIVCTPYLLFLKGYLQHLASLLVSTYLLACCAPIAIWSIGGLEQPLLAALLCLSFICLFPFDAISWPLPGVFLGLIAITRPDGILFAGCACLSILFVKGISKQSILLCLKIMLLPFLFFVAQLIFRYDYYGTLVPNTALVKISFSFQRLVTGIKYVAGGIVSLFPFSFILPVLLFVLYRRNCYREMVVFISLTCMAWFSYLVFIGGDIFPGSRHFLPVIPLLAIGIALGTDTLLPAITAKFRGVKIAVVCCAVFSLYISVQMAFPNNARAKEERWEWDGKAIAGMLKEEWKEEKPLFAITAAGCLPYWSEFPCIDMLGLNDYYIPRHPPREFGKGYLGHDLGDADYVLSRKPDLISFCGPNGSLKPCFTADKQLTHKVDFLRNYQAAFFRTPLPLVTQAIVWIRKNSDKIGTRISGDTVVIPCWLLSTEKSPVIQDADKKFIVETSPNDTLLLRALSLPEGTWKIQLNKNKPVGMINTAGEGWQVVSSGEGYTLFSGAKGSLGLVTKSPENIRTVLLTRVKND